MVVCRGNVPYLQMQKHALPRMCLAHLDMQALEFKQLAEQAQNLSCQTVPWFKRCQNSNPIRGCQCCKMFIFGLFNMLAPTHIRMDQQIYQGLCCTYFGGTKVHLHAIWGVDVSPRPPISLHINLVSLHICHDLLASRENTL